MREALRTAQSSMPRGTRRASMDARIEPALSRLIQLRLEARDLGLSFVERVAANRAGTYLSAYKGRGIDFEETRVYQPGDDFRTVDWRVTARTGEPHTKVFREERERPVLFLVDQRSSMDFGTRGRFKCVTAAEAAAVLAWAAVDKGDRVGGLICTQSALVESRVIGRRMGALQLLKSLTSSRQREALDTSVVPLRDSLARLRQLARPGSLVIVVSDFRGLDEEAHSLLATIARNCELICVMIYDVVEANAPPADQYAITDGAQFSSFDTRNPAVVQAYEHHFRKRLAELGQLTGTHGARLLTLDGEGSVVTSLKLQLQRRGGPRRG
ncbi:MAG: DUF58 domain-containing protein [Thiotrichales bacterium]|nr:DUF58 domain-containing protein [Thiotrichales bacterium]